MTPNLNDIIFVNYDPFAATTEIAVGDENGAVYQVPGGIKQIVSYVLNLAKENNKNIVRIYSPKFSEHFIELMKTEELNTYGENKLDIGSIDV